MDGRNLSYDLDMNYVGIKNVINSTRLLRAEIGEMHVFAKNISIQCLCNYCLGITNLIWFSNIHAGINLYSRCST